LERNIEKKNQTAENTLKYLDEQLQVIEDSLTRAEENLQTFRSNNRIMNITNKTTTVFEDANQLEKQRDVLKSHIKYYNFISENLNKSESASSLLVPSSLGINDAVLTNLIEEYIRLNTERNNLINTDQTLSPYYNNLNIRINTQKNVISENIKNLIQTTKIELDNINDRLNEENAQISALPTTERNLSRVERKYDLNDDNYNYMLRKRAEAQVAKASDMQSNDIVEPARLSQLTPVFPNKVLNLSLGAFLGLVIPFGVFGFKGFFNKSISGESDVQSVTNFPTIGRVFRSHDKKKQSAILINEPRSAISESIRSIRSNIEHFLDGKRHKVILLTSAMQGDGKSFNSLNIAISLSMIERKTIIVDFDIRKEKNSFEALEVERQIGLSSYLGGNKKLQDIIVSTKIPFLDYIPAGPIPGNPGELVTSEKVDQLIDTLRENYDYVIIDTPPLGLVKEAFVLMKFADLKIFVVRDNKTQKNQLVELLEEMEEKKMKDVYWLLNDVDIRHTVYSKKNGYYTFA
jgi:capsular exopolysaccharide synthesis family protein